MEDTQIIDLYWQRDDSAISCTDEKYGAYCYTVAHRILESPQDSEECVNDTWLRAWNSMPPQRPQRLRMFLAAITRNLSLDRVRGRLTQRRGGGSLDLALEELEGCVSGSPEVEDEAIARELGSSIDRFLATLTQRNRSIFLRRYFFLDTAEDIARRYGITAGAVTASLHRTRQKLREHLKKEGYFDE